MSIEEVFEKYRQNYYNIGPNDDLNIKITLTKVDKPLDSAPQEGTGYFAYIYFGDEGPIARNKVENVEDLAEFIKTSLNGDT